ncbi:MAG: type II secretion system protein GspM [Betaproteobacteria bacterium]
MVTAALARLPARQQRALAVALAVVAVLVVLALLVAPVWLLHQRYDDSIASLEDRLERYRRIAAQAPEYRKALDQIRERDGHRFFLKNTAANLAGVEVQELVRGAIEGNGGRITTSQNQAPRDEGRYKAIGVTFQLFATTPNLQKILFALETQQPYLVVETLTLRPLNAFRGFKPAAGQEPEVNVQIDVVAWSFAAADKPADKSAAKEKAAARP